MKKLLTVSLLVAGLAMVTACGQKVFDKNNTLGEKPQNFEGTWLDIESYETYQEAGDLLKDRNIIDLFEIKNGFMFTSGKSSYSSHKVEKLQRPLMIENNGQAVAVDIYSDVYKEKLEKSCKDAKEDFNATNARNVNGRFIENCLEGGEELYNDNFAWAQETAPDTVYSIPEEGLLKKTTYNSISRKLPAESRYYVKVDGMLDEFTNKMIENSEVSNSLYNQFGETVDCDGVLKCAELSKKLQKAIVNVDRALLKTGKKGYKENEKAQELSISASVLEQVNSRKPWISDGNHSLRKVLYFSVSSTQEDIEKALLDELLENGSTEGGQ